MKIVLLLFMVFSAFLCSKDRINEKNCLSLYKHSNFRELVGHICRSKTFFNDYFRYNAKGDRVTSVCAGSGVSWALYAKGFKGRKIILKGGNCIKNLRRHKLTKISYAIKLTRKKKNKKKKKKKNKKKRDRKLKRIINKYNPYIYIARKEKFYPQKIEKITNWKGVTKKQFSDKNYNLKLYTKGEKWDSNAPVYVNVRDKKKYYHITYVIVQAYNGCGPKGKVIAQAFRRVNVNTWVKLCPGGIHYGDFEHLTVEVNKKTEKVKRIHVSYHSFSKWHSWKKFEKKNGRPVVYMAEGSHALYLRSGHQYYMKMWSKSKRYWLPCGVKVCSRRKRVPYPCGVKICTKRKSIRYPCGIKKCKKRKRISFTCVKWCKKWKARYPCGKKTCHKTVSVSYPCGKKMCRKTIRAKYPCGKKICHKSIRVKYPCGVKKCHVRAKTSGHFVDFTDRGRLWNPKIRWIGVEGKPRKRLTVGEKNLMKFKGRLGQEIKNDGWRKFKKSVLKITWPLRKLHSSIDKEVKNGLKNGNELESAGGSSGLATKGWWENGGTSS